MKIPDKTDRFNAYLDVADAAHRLAVTAEITLPTFEYMSETINLSGMAGEVDLVLVYKCGQEKLNNLYYQVKEQRRCSTWQKNKNLTLRNSNSRLWICIMPGEPRIHNWNVNMA